MNQTLTIRILCSQLVLAIWNPDTWNLHPKPTTRTALRLKYKVIGIVLHDRALNGEYDDIEEQIK